MSKKIEMLQSKKKKTLDNKKNKTQPGVELSAMEQQRIEMLETMMDAEAKKLASCAVLLQSFWRGLIERRQALTLLALPVQKYKY